MAEEKSQDTNQSTPDGKALGPGEIAAFAETMAYHGLVAQAYSLNFVNAYAVFNGGAFAACIAVLSTTYGQAIMHQFYWMALVTFISFTVGFAASTYLMMNIFLYSNARYYHYREVLRGWKRGRVANKDNKYSKRAKVFLGIMLVMTAIGITSTTIIVARLDFDSYFELLLAKQKALIGP